MHGRRLPNVLFFGIYAAREEARGCDLFSLGFGCYLFNLFYSRRLRPGPRPPGPRPLAPLGLLVPGLRPLPVGLGVPFLRVGAGVGSGVGPEVGAGVGPVVGLSWPSRTQSASMT